MKESCFTYARAPSYHLHMSKVYMNTSRHTVHIWISHFTRVDESEFPGLFSLSGYCRTSYHLRMLKYIWMHHVKHMNESCTTYEWATSYHLRMLKYIRMHYVKHMNESCFTYGWAKSYHLCMRKNQPRHTICVCERMSQVIPSVYVKVYTNASRHTFHIWMSPVTRVDEPEFPGTF